MLQKWKSLCLETDSGEIGEMNIIFDGHKLNSSSSIKCLGVFLDEYLDWNKHLRSLLQT